MKKTKEPLEEGERGDWKFNIQKRKFTASGPITSWQKVEAVTGFTFLGSKITVDGDCSHELKEGKLWQTQTAY